MPLPLLGGLLAVAAGQYGFDKYYDYLDDQDRIKNQNLLDVERDRKQSLFDQNIGSQGWQQQGPTRPGVDAPMGQIGQSGLLGNVQQQMQAKGNLLSNGITPQEIQSLVAPQVAAQTQQNKMGLFSDANQYATQLSKLSDRQSKAVQPFQQAALGYTQVKNLMTDKEGQQIPIDKLSGNFDLALQRNFIKGLSVLRPEAYMQDDAVQAFMASQNIGDVAQLKNYFAGDIKLDETGRKQMIKAYESIMKDNFIAMESVAQPFEDQRESFFPNTPRETIFGAPIGSYGEGLYNPEPPVNTAPQGKMSYDQWRKSKGY